MKRDFYGLRKLETFGPDGGNVGAGFGIAGTEGFETIGLNMRSVTEPRSGGPDHMSLRQLKIDNRSMLRSMGRFQ